MINKIRFSIKSLELLISEENEKLVQLIFLLELFESNQIVQKDLVCNLPKVVITYKSIDYLIEDIESSRTRQRARIHELHLSQRKLSALIYKEEIVKKSKPKLT